VRAIATLLRLLDRGDEPLVDSETIRSLGECDLNVLVRAGVLVPSEPTMKVNATCGECSVHDVIRVDRNTGTEFYEVCPHDGVEWVDKDRLRQWAIDGRAIADLLASSMARGGSSETLLPGVAWRIGDMRIDGETFSVVLTTTRSAPTLAGRSGASRMILVGDELPREGFAGCLSMTEAFAMSSGQIESRPHRFQQVLPLSSVRSGNAFYRKGQMWVVRFRGNETFLENNVGPLYIARLLATPHRAVPAVTLLASRIGIDERTLIGSSGELADEQSVNECRDRYRELMGAIAEAESNNDIGQLEKLQVEQDQLASHFASVLGKGGKRREVDDAKKVRQSVSKGIKRTLDVLELELKPLADHLHANLRLGICPMYSPPFDVDWLV
jgi:hypothetical protein